MNVRCLSIEKKVIMNQNKFEQGSHHVIQYSLSAFGRLGHRATVVTSGLLLAPKTKTNVITCITFSV